MRRAIPLTKHSFRLTACLAVFAALWLTTSQALELSHLHGWADSDGYEHSLTFQADSGAAIASQPPRIAHGVPNDENAGPTLQIQQRDLSTTPARGPPKHS